MKDINVNISTKASAILGGLVLAVLISALGWAYLEMSDMRRDLYAVRDDYYGISDEQPAEVEFTLLSQEAREVRVQDTNAELNCEDDKYSCEYPYKNQKVRVVELKVNNHQDYLYSYYDGSLAAVNEDGRLLPTLYIHPDDNQNDWATDYGSLEMIPGAEATIYVYIRDEGSEITSLYDSEFSKEIKLQ